jgi:hypothetical protein
VLLNKNMVYNIKVIFDILSFCNFAKITINISNDKYYRDNMSHDDDGFMKGGIKNLFFGVNNINRKILIPIFLIFFKNLFLTVIYLQ